MPAVSRALHSLAVTARSGGRRYHLPARVLDFAQEWPLRFSMRSVFRGVALEHPRDAGIAHHFSERDWERLPAGARDMKMQVGQQTVSDMATGRDPLPLLDDVPNRNVAAASPAVSIGAFPVQNLGRLSSQPVQPPGGESQPLPRLGVRRAPQFRAVEDRVLAGGRAGLLLRDLWGRWGTDAPGECR